MRGSATDVAIFLLGRMARFVALTWQVLRPDSPLGVTGATPWGLRPPMRHVCGARSPAFPVGECVLLCPPLSWEVADPRFCDAPSTDSVEGFLSGGNAGLDIRRATAPARSIEGTDVTRASSLHTDPVRTPPPPLSSPRRSDREN